LSRTSKCKSAAAAVASVALFLGAAGASVASAAPTALTPNTATPQAEAGIFNVGTSVVDITPHKPMPDGGYGSDYIVTGGAHDPLQVRAFFIGHGKQAVVFVTVDSQGWFAEYQSPNVGDGGDDARTDAAAALAARGYDVTTANIVLSSTHSHAAPTLMGLWGHTDPQYLHWVKEAAVRAVIKAASHTHEAELWSATGTIRGLVSQLQGTDQTAGYSVDTQLPILWARQPGTGATIATYSAVPVHADEYDPTAAGNNQWSADYPGWVRNRLAKLLGGTNVVAVATLGRQETIGNEPHYNEVEKQGSFVANAITTALTHARPITDTTLAADNTQFATEATNTGLLAAMSCNHPGGSLGCPGPLNEPKSNHGRGTWNWEEVGGIFTINRSMEAPYFNAEDFTVGSSATVARIGNQVYATVPGEGFAEVTEAIERTFASSPGIEAAHVIDEGSDTLGYYGDYGAYPSGHMEGDLQSNNVGPNVGDDAVNAIAQDGENLGLEPATEQVTADITNPQAYSEPGIQFYPDRVETEEPTVSFYASAKAAVRASHSASTTIGSSAGTQGDGSISWNFGDGTTELRPDAARFSHTFPGPGLYSVTASVTDNLGDTYSWTQSVRIDTPLSATVVQTPGSGKSVVLSVSAQGGEGNVIAARWTFADGRTAEGTTITLPHKPQEGSVTITDGAGNAATTSVNVG
jgi:PKD domain